MIDHRTQALLAQLRQQGIRDERILRIIEIVPRKCFIDKAFEHRAYDNIALPIGFEQTISQPYIVARMTELLALHPESRVLEIGTGTGYQTAILSHLVNYVYSIERIKKLQLQAKSRFKQLSIHNISVNHGDGWQGLPSKSPFDAIIVTAAPPEIPTALITQLNDDGVMVLPVGKDKQYLTRVQYKDKKLTVETFEAVHFVPMIKGQLV